MRGIRHATHKIPRRISPPEARPKIDEAARAAEAAKAAEATKTAALDAAREAKRKLRPVSVFISLKIQRLYVRQALEPVFESPVTVRDPDKPIGTHIYTALGYANEGAVVRWSRRGGDDRNAKTVSTDSSAATATLDRVTVPQDVIDRISEVVLPGFSLIISDEDISKETGPATDFIILKSGEPQGGLKNWPRNSGASYRYEIEPTCSRRHSAILVKCRCGQTSKASQRLIRGRLPCICERGMLAALGAVAAGGFDVHLPRER